MNVTYTWAVTGLKTATIENKVYVVQTYWTKTGVDEQGNTGVFEGATPFEPNQHEVVGQLSDLLEQTVVDWIQEAIVGNYGQHIDNIINRQIVAKRSRVEAVPVLPWAS